MDTSGLSNRLTNYGIHVDDLSRLRVLDEAAGNHAHDLRQEHIKYGTNTDSFPLSAYLPYARHYNPLLIRNHS